ncbi:MAG: DUF1822 family protein, partial [Microcoleus sp. SIO2G3]|nr:DUF1822 family protein [Microcoleus sp. SIO2G3]
AIGARGTDAAETALALPSGGIALSRQITIANQLHELRVIPLQTEPNQVWRFELQNLTLGGQIAPGTTLRLLSEDLQPFPDNEDTAIEAVDRLYIDVALAAGEGIVWEVEPAPIDYDLEILRF